MCIQARPFLHKGCTWLFKCGSAQVCIQARPFLRKGGTWLFNHVMVPKAIPLQAWTGSNGSRRLRLPEFLGKLLGNNPTVRSKRTQTYRIRMNVIEVVCEDEKRIELVYDRADRSDGTSKQSPGFSNHFDIL